MRYRYYSVVQDLQGNVVAGANVSVYLAGTTTGATVYSSNTASTGTNTAPQVTSAPDGSVVFWLDSNDYTNEQLFDISIVSDSLSMSLSSVQIIVWDAVNAVNATNAQNAVSAQNATNATNAQNAALLNNQNGDFYLSRANHTGTQSPSSISPQGSGSGLNADLLDGLDSSLFLAFSIVFGG